MTRRTGGNKPIVGMDPRVRTRGRSWGPVKAALFPFCCGALVSAAAFVFLPLEERQAAPPGSPAGMARRTVKSDVAAPRDVSNTSARGGLMDATAELRRIEELNARNRQLTAAAGGAINRPGGPAGWPAASGTPRTSTPPPGTLAPRPPAEAGAFPFAPVPNGR
ncbi:MAG: hypothetical protein NTV86_08180 [Planctomycetota bacterium]|nr:hypothetical protein [Planctomycetota bacterium]